MGSCRHRGGTIRGAGLWSYYKNKLHRKSQGVEVWPMVWKQHTCMANLQEIYMLASPENPFTSIANAKTL
jgi:hypothetical protein